MSMNESRDGFLPGDIPADILAVTALPMSIKNVVSKKTLCRFNTPILASQGSQKLIVPCATQGVLY